MACRLANAFSRRGHEVHIFSRETVPWVMEGQVRQHALVTRGANAHTALYWDWTEAELHSFADLLLAAFTAQRFDVLHYHYAQPFAAIISRAAQALGQRMPPAIGTLHGTDLTRWLSDGTRLASIRHELAATSALTTVSQHMGRLASELPGLLPLPRVLPNFVEDDWPAAGVARVANKTRGGANRQPTILHVSNFRAVKDVGLLARVLLAVQQEIDVELCLVGDGPELTTLQSLFEHEPATVRYLGECAQPAIHFREATVLLSTSTEESFGLAVLEAMASGVVVVATAVGGIPELIEDEVSGLLFEPGDWRQVADRIVSLLAAPERLEAMRQAARRRAQRLRESVVIGQYENLYRETVQTPAPNPAPNPAPIPAMNPAL